MDVAAKRIEWRGTLYDSVLEADWAVTLDWLGWEAVHHPGKVTLDEGGWWEPDFLVPERHVRDRSGRQADVLLEVKGWHDERAWKALSAARRSGYDVLIGREGLVPPGSAVESAGMVWHNARPGGREWFIVWDAETSEFVLTPQAEDCEHVFCSAERTLTNPALAGLGMRKVPR